jgi:hypothetical protein
MCLIRYLYGSRHSPSRLMFAEFLHSFFVSSDYGHFCILPVY